MVIDVGLHLKEATYEDCNLIFNWANDEYVRKNSFNESKISYENHVSWFKDRLSSDNCIIFILYFHKTPIGQIRIDIKGSYGIIDYSIDKNHRGSGYGSKILHMMEEVVIINYNDINKLIGKVKYNNIKSQRAFERNKYKKTLEKENFLYLKDITFK